MKTFITDDFLLYNDTAQDLFHHVAKKQPIIDYHNHLNQHEILADKQYDNLTEIWLGGDHYKWRAMRANGVEEAYITGSKSSEEKFKAWARTVPHTFGNPLYHWTHIELQRYFGIDELLNEKSAPAIYEEANRQLRTPKLSVRSILDKENVVFIGTTDDPTDDLLAHQQLAKEKGFNIQVSPSFRPDQAIAIEKANFPSWIEKLEQCTGDKVDTYDKLLQALESRVAFFSEIGCRSSDHSIGVMFYEEATAVELNAIFQKRLQGELLSEKEVNKFKTQLLLALGEMYADKGWAMQLHLGALRNNNTRMFAKLGPDSGYDAIGDSLLANKLSRFLDALEAKEKLPKTVLYSLNSKDYHVLAAMAGNYQNAEVAGKVQFGTAWWFNDSIDGMENQMKILANIGLISNFIGMLTDSRSFLSFSRHDYFRRILCNFLGTWVEEKKIPKDMDLLETYVKNICYDNAKHYFNLQ
ncbi:glucuronate isomerase [Virgibacillus halophilus]|uniref:Uronate isomerase n=1 Tax=Tigheibacillus halophilus TaxID=361280 RepID=A0ABU5C5J7_9BACI|nr:glucuronate isomerase [Virgibacillus halophilus]